MPSGIGREKRESAIGAPPVRNGIKETGLLRLERLQDGCRRLGSLPYEEGLQQTLQRGAVLRDFFALVSVIRPLESRPIAPLQAIVLMDSTMDVEATAATPATDDDPVTRSSTSPSAPCTCKVSVPPSLRPPHLQLPTYPVDDASSVVTPSTRRAAGCIKSG